MEFIKYHGTTETTVSDEAILTEEIAKDMIWTHIQLVEALEGDWWLEVILTFPHMGEVSMVVEIHFGMAYVAPDEEGLPKEVNDLYCRIHDEAEALWGDKLILV